MKVKGFVVLCGPNFGKWKDKEGAETRFAFNHKFFELEDQARDSVRISVQKCKSKGWTLDDIKIVRIECEGKELS